MTERFWKIGEVAKRTGLTVRTLHHYDEIGLLVPVRMEASYRYYDGDHLRRLYQIMALRSLHVPLYAIANILDSQDVDLEDVLRKQLEDVEQQLQFQSQLRDRIAYLLDTIKVDGVADPEKLIQLMETMTMITKHYTKEQLAELEQRRGAMGEDAIQKAQQDWSELIAEVEAEMKKGTKPEAPAAQALADRWESLIEAFTGGNPEIRASLEKMYADEGPEKASQGAVSVELVEYIKQAIAAKRSK